MLVQRDWHFLVMVKTYFDSYTIDLLRQAPADAVGVCTFMQPLSHQRAPGRHRGFDGESGCDGRGQAGARKDA